MKLKILITGTAPNYVARVMQSIPGAESAEWREVPHPGTRTAGGADETPQHLQEHTARIGMGDRMRLYYEEIEDKSPETRLNQSTSREFRGIVGETGTGRLAGLGDPLSSTDLEVGQRA